MGNFVNDRVIADLFTYCDENDKRAREKSAEWLASKAVADSLRTPSNGKVCARRMYRPNIFVTSALPSRRRLPIRATLRLRCCKTQGAVTV